MHVKASCLALSILLLTGCLVTSNNQKKTEGKYVAESTFNELEIGKTTSAWVKATLGEPSETTEADGAQVWKYNYKEIKEGSGAIFLIFGGSNREEKQGTAFIEFKNGIVTRKWRG